ncbi:unnamed protein product [Durusdinium trenchii]|uniref:Uncharacterized protein n=1 Tax=Durusdinium trenchii TaxID=1381693 RepID=A0ABP0RSR5_9DINO
MAVVTVQLLCQALEVKLLQCPAVPLLNRCYFKMGPRFWTSANAIVMGTTVLGQDSHPGYKLMNICVIAFELMDYFYHVSVATALRTLKPFWVGRLSGTEAVMLDTWAIGKWLCVGSLLMVGNLFLPAMYAWNQQADHSSTIVLLIAAAMKLAFLPVIVKPHIATTLMMELDVHHLCRWTEHLNVPTLPHYVTLVGLVKTKWRRFLRIHFALELVPPLAYIFAMLLLLFGMRPHPEVLMVVSAAPLSMAYLWLQVLPLARFNQMIVDWQLSTENNDTFRILWQKERDLMFTVWRYRITFRKVRLSIASLAASMLIKQGRTLAMALTHAFDETEPEVSTILLVD